MPALIEMIEKQEGRKLIWKMALKGVGDRKKAEGRPMTVFDLFC